MGWVIAGEGGAVLVEAQRASEDVSGLVIEGLAGTFPAPGGLMAHPVDRSPAGADGVRLVEAAASTRAVIRSWGLPVNETPTRALDPPPGVRVVAVSSPYTGSGKTSVVRKVARALRRSGVEVVVLRHPVPSLLGWPDTEPARIVRVPEELSAPGPLDEREELAPVVGAGVAVVSGTDPRAMLELALSAAKVIVWDGGGSARPWVTPDISIVVVDALRSPDDAASQRLSEADAVVVAKVDSAPEGRVREWEELVSRAAPDAALTLADLPIGVPEGMLIRRRAVVVVEDWPSLILGGLRAGAGMVAARRWGCGVVDPRPFAVGSVAAALQDHPHIAAVVPSLGRTPSELEDLTRTLTGIPAEAIVWASPASPDQVVGPEGDGRPVVRAYPEIMEVAGVGMQELLRPLLPGYG